MSDLCPTCGISYPPGFYHLHICPPSKLGERLAPVNLPELCVCGHDRASHRADEPSDHEECGVCFCTDFVHARHS